MYMSCNTERCERRERRETRSTAQSDGALRSDGRKVAGGLEAALQIQMYITYSRIEKQECGNVCLWGRGGMEAPNAQEWWRMPPCNNASVVYYGRQPSANNYTANLEFFAQLLLFPTRSRRSCGFFFAMRRFSASAGLQQHQQGERRCLNTELWHACAGLLVSLPPPGTRVVYFSQGHSEQVAETRFASHTIVLRRLLRVKEALCQMVISNKWGGWKQVDTEKAKIVKDLIFSDDFWNRVEYALELTEPLMSMLRYADTDEPCLGNIYDAMDSMLERMKLVIQRREQDPDTLYSTVEKIVLHRWNKMTTPLHLLAYALSPRYYSSEILDIPGRVPPYRDPEVAAGYKRALNRLFSDPDVASNVRREFVDFVSGKFAEPDAINDQSRLDAIGWWYLHGERYMYLQPLAIKILSQVAASTNKKIDGDIPNYPNLPPELICQLHNVTMHADIETDEVYAQMTLQPLNQQEQKESYLVPNLDTPSRQPTNYFCKTLTPSDTSTHGGFSIPRRAAEKVFPPLDFSQQPPCQELIARDLHENEWKFRHIYRGQPKRHLLTTGWSMFASAKRLVAGDSVLFFRNEKEQLFLGIRRAKRAQTIIPSSVLSSDSMHIGILAAAAHAYSTNSPFTVFYNPRACPSEFVIPLSKYEKAVYHMHVSIGMRFRMLFETEDSSVRRYMGTITGIGDMDPVRWPNSQWRSIKVGWDESAVGETKMQVSRWEIEPLATFLMYPPAYPLGLKCHWSQMQGIPFLQGVNGERNFQSSLNMDPWMRIKPSSDSFLQGFQPEMYQETKTVASHDMSFVPSKQLLQFPQLQLMRSQEFQNGLKTQLQKNVIQQSQNPQEHLLHQQVKNLQHQLPQEHFMQQLHHASLQHSMKEQKPSFEQQFYQQQMFHVPNVIGTSPQLPLSPHQSTSSLKSSINSKPVVANSCTNLDSTRNSSSPRQRILGSLGSEESTYSMMLPKTCQTVLQQPCGILPGPGAFEDRQTFPAPWSSPKRLSNNQPVQYFSTGEVSPYSSRPSQSVSQSNISPHSVLMPQFTFEVCSSGQERNQPDSQSSFLSGFNVDTPSSVISNTELKNASNSPDPCTILSATNLRSTCPASSNFVSHSSAVSSRGLEEGDFSECETNLVQVNPCTRTFTKVYKLGSVGRSLDVMRFRSYPDLRSELARMFGLEGVLEDSRSGWQLVFVDKENDVLLLGDDPWQEFINNVRFIKVLSPPEVLQMSQEGMVLLSSNPAKRLTSSSAEESISRHEPYTMGSLEY